MVADPEQIEHDVKRLNLRAKLPFDYDWKNPDIKRVLLWRANRLVKIRQTPGAAGMLRLFYRDHPAQLINDWGMTFDPRNAEIGLPTSVPFILFPKQFEWVEWVIERWRKRQYGLTEKSRECGVSWLAMCLSCSLCIAYTGVTIGFGSEKKDKVDRLGDPDSLFWKGRFYLKNLPPEFRGGWIENKHAASMRLLFPRSGSSITGEAGDNIGRGGRKSLYFIDESAHIEHPDVIENSMASCTNCRQDISSVRGMANAFAQRRHAGKTPVFTFSWMHDPRKDQKWHDDQATKLTAVALSQEVDMNYLASVTGAVIPGEWIMAAVGLCQKLGIVPSGTRRAGLDVADEGSDDNALAGRHGVELQHLQSWSGKGLDIYRTTLHSFWLMDEWGYADVDYDADGLGAGVRGDAKNINEDRASRGIAEIRHLAFRGSGSVADPEGQVLAADGETMSERTNKDYFENLKAQSWWGLRQMFQAAWRATQGLPYKFEQIISIDPNLPELPELIMELAQPTYTINRMGKILVDKQPDGIRSPNRADAVMIAFNPQEHALEAWMRLGQ